MNRCTTKEGTHQFHKLPPFSSVRKHTVLPVSMYQMLDQNKLTNVLVKLITKALY